MGSSVVVIVGFIWFICGVMVSVLAKSVVDRGFICGVMVIDRGFICGVMVSVLA